MLVILISVYIIVSLFYIKIINYKKNCYISKSYIVLANVSVLLLMATLFRSVKSYNFEYE